VLCLLPLAANRAQIRDTVRRFTLAEFRANFRPVYDSFRSNFRSSQRPVVLSDPIEATPLAGKANTLAWCARTRRMLTPRQPPNSAGNDGTTRIWTYALPRSPLRNNQLQKSGTAKRWRRPASASRQTDSDRSERAAPLYFRVGPVCGVVIVNVDLIFHYDICGL
jgi:hypothetical protein